MSESPHPFPAPRRLVNERLDSWKEIASYLGREVRTVQGWEKSEGLPIHRHQHARQGSVYAFTSELDAWREVRHGAPDSPPAPEIPAADASAPPHGAQPEGAQPEGTPQRPPDWMFATVGIAALLVVAVSWGFFFWKSGQATPAGPVGNGVLSSVVVLPFLDLSPTKDQEYFTDGLTEEIIDALSRVPNLRVVARTSAFAFKGKATDIREIGHQLNVSAVLEGSVRKSGDALRITAQLNRVSDGYHLWSQTYDRPLRDVFAVQRELSQSIADKLQAGEVPQRPGTSDLEAYRLFQEGRYLFNQHQPPESYLKAAEKYKAAIQRDPKFALAYAGLADAYAYLAEQFVAAPKDVMPKAKEAAEKALALDDDSAEAHTSLGIVKLDYERDREGAQREFRRAMELNPSSGYMRHWFAHSLEAQGRIEDAMREMRASLVLDPLLLPPRWDLANELLWVKRYDEALEQTKRMDELFPNMSVAAYLKVEAYNQQGDLKAARGILESLKSSQPEAVKETPYLALFGVAAAREGRRAEAVQILDELEQMRRTQYVEPALVLELCSVLHDHKALLRWLKRADEERSTQFIYLPFHNREAYAEVPEAEALVARIH